MATPVDVDLVHAGVDKILKLQAEKGKITLNRIAKSRPSGKQGYHDVKRITGFRDPRSYGRGETIEPDRKVVVDETQFYPLLFAKAWEVMHYDSDDDYYDQLASNMNDAAIAMMRRKDKQEQGLFGNGFDTSFTWADGQTLFSTAHTGATGVTSQANRPASGNSLDVLAVESAFVGIRGQTDFNGESLYLNGPIEAWTGPALEPLMWRIINTEFQAGTPDNDKSFMAMHARAMCGQQLSSTTAHYYKMADDDLHGLRMIEFSPYRVVNGAPQNNLGTTTTVYERYKHIAETWQGTYGDPGA